MKRQIEADRFIFGGGSCVGGVGWGSGKVAKFILKFQENQGVGGSGGLFFWSDARMNVLIRLKTIFQNRFVLAVTQK